MSLPYLQPLIDRPLLGLLAAGASISIFKPLLRFLYVELRPSSLPRYKHGSTAAWALVTGASDGIGFGFASELALKGFDVILHGRNQSKVDGLIKDLQVKFPDRAFRAFVVDASDRSAWHKIDKFVQSLIQENINLTVLVNNVGVGAGKSGIPFVASDEISYDDINTIIDTNTTFPAQVTRALLPLLKKNQPSLIINLGSAAGAIGIPYLATYSATKAFNFIWSTSLRRELLMDKQDIEVFSVHVGKVQSAGTKMVPTTAFVPSSATFAKATLQKVGCGDDMVSGYWGHTVQFGMFSLLPSFLMDGLGMSLAKSEIALQKKAL